MRRLSQGFALLEIMIVVLIIGLLAAICIPMFQKARTDALAVRFINDLKKASDAFELYAMENGDYPPDRTPGVIPPGMAEYLPKMDWWAQTVIGGQWDWDFLQYQFGCRAGLSVYRPRWAYTEMLLIDRKIDDGDLSSGMFRKRPAGYVYIIQK